MAKPAPKVSLRDLTAIARDAVRGQDLEVLGAVPSEGDSEYAEIVVDVSGLGATSLERVTIGVDRTQSRDRIHEQIVERIRARA